jgi:raffinose/stachyose/melibiose transport system permease protein
VRRRTRWFIVSFLAPASILYAMFIIYPFLSSVRYSLYNWTGIGPLKDFIGLKNYAYALFSSDFAGQFWRAMLHNVYFFVLTIFLVSVCGLGIAYFLTRVKERYAQWLEVIYFLPMVIPPIVVAYLWAMYLEPNQGTIPAFLSALHLNFLNIPFLGEARSALPTIAVITVWATLGYSVFIFIPAINNIPTEMFEAARVDGAGSIRIFFSIVFRMIMPTYLTICTLVFISAFGIFDYVFILESQYGGPNYATDVLSTLFFRIAFGTMNGQSGGLGLASALAVIGFVVVMIASSILVVFQKRASRDL